MYTISTAQFHTDLFVYFQYETGTLIIRYDNQVLVPSGSFQSDINMSDSTSGGLLSWHIAIIVLGIVVLLILVIIIIAAVSAYMNWLVSAPGQYLFQ